MAMARPCPPDRSGHGARAGSGGGVALAEFTNSRVRKLDIAGPPLLPASASTTRSVSEGNSGTKTLTFTSRFRRPRLRR
jgi:hypothetical protein